MRYGGELSPVKNDGNYPGSWMIFPWVTDMCPTTWMSQEVSKWLVSGLFHLLINGVYWGYNPFSNHLLTSWDIQVCAKTSRQFWVDDSPFPKVGYSNLPSYPSLNLTAKPLKNGGWMMMSCVWDMAYFYRNYKKIHYFPWNTGWFIGILILVYSNPHIIG